MNTAHCLLAALMYIALLSLLAEEKQGSQNVWRLLSFVRRTICGHAFLVEMQRPKIHQQLCKMFATSKPQSMRLMFVSLVFSVSQQVPIWRMTSCFVRHQANFSPLLSDSVVVVENRMFSSICSSHMMCKQHLLGSAGDKNGKWGLGEKNSHHIYDYAIPTHNIHIFVPLFQPKSQVCAKHIHKIWDIRCTKSGYGVNLNKLSWQIGPGT